MVLRELLVKLGLDVDEASFAKGQLAADAIKLGLEKVVEWGREAVRGIGELVTSTAEAGKEMDETAQSTGLTTEALQQLRYAARLSGVEVEQLDIGIFHLSRSMAAAKKGSDEHAAAFKKLGVRVVDAHGKLRATDDVIGDLAAGFQKLPDGAEKTALAMDVFGRSGARLIPMLNKGKEGLDEFRKSAFVMSEEQVKAGAEVTITLREISLYTRDLWRSAIAPLLPAISELLKRYLAWRKENGAILKQKITQYIGYVVKAVGLLGSAMDFLIKNATAVKYILGGAGLIAVFIALGDVAVSTAIKSAAAWVVALAPFLAIAAVVAGILLVFDDLRVYQQDVASGSKVQHSMFGLWKKQIDELFEPHPGDLPIVAQLREMGRLIKDSGDSIRQLMRDFQEFFDMFSDGIAIYNGSLAFADAAMKGDAAGARAAADSITPALRRRAGTAFARDNPYQAKYGYGTPNASGAPLASPSSIPWSQSPEVPASFAPAPGSSTVHAPVVIQVTQQPGESGEDFARRVSSHIEDHWQSRMEEADAGVSY